ncbi:MAG: MBL fold metallo-hydrolase [Candidatus Hydrogenedentes bacterium]|nr:MBL fold metallo-hydrolase [Candidatus Hydrogenedentota bacterium]
MKPKIIDCHYQGPEHAASYLLKDRGEAAFIENNTARALPYLLQGMEEDGIRPESVRWIIITHLHFDHAGGTSALAERCPDATVLAHSRAVRHLVDPSRLVASAMRVYGEEEFERLYDRIRPIPAGRVRAMEDHEKVELGGHTLTFLHTRGHANHHFCIHDSDENAVYTGDTFGVEYRKSRPSVKPFLLCSAAPTDFDPDEARASVRRILALDPSRVYLTHFGELDDPAGGAEVFLAALDRLEAILNDAVESGLSGAELEAFCEERVRAAIDAHLAWCGAVLNEQDHVYIDPHANINAQGIALLAEKRRQTR